MSKYIVKNCPCIYKSYRAEYDCDYDGPCEDCVDCLIKQVIELCKQKVEFCKNCSKHANVSIDCVECEGRGEATLGLCILKNLFEIEECE